VSLKEESSLYKEIERRMPCEDGCRDWSEESTNQEIPGIVGNPQKLVERHRMYSPSEPLKFSFSFSEKEPALLTP